ncbi:hypothetical protein [Orientia tsutsugamushi]|uniref:hypothetical protein n=1 Tax=Orientia tsutsugamushi TaxID=784 RepID=UPI000AF3F127|nr:hypothetical protein [Orientia tsutsugamushi]
MRLKYTTRRDYFTEKLKGLRKYLLGQLNQKDKTQILLQVIRVIRRWINYHGISDNERQVSSFINQSTLAIYNWFNRMGGKRKINLQRLTEIPKRDNFPKNGKIISMF